MLKIAQSPIDVWGMTEEQKEPFKGKIVLCPGGVAAYVSMIGAVWGLPNEDYVFFKTLHDEQERKSVISGNENKVMIPPFNTTDAAHMVFNNCSGITIQK